MSPAWRMAISASLAAVMILVVAPAIGIGLRPLFQRHAPTLPDNASRWVQQGDACVRLPDRTARP